MNDDRPLIEKLAELEHDQWCFWAERLIDTETLSKEREERWKQYLVPYEELPEEVKEADREWARKVIKVLDDEDLLC